MNLVSRDTNLRNDVIEDIRRSFTSLVAYKVPEEVSEVIYCSYYEAAAQRATNKKGGARDREMHSFRRVNAAVGGTEEFLDIAESAKLLKIV